MPGNGAGRAASGVEMWLKLVWLLFVQFCYLWATGELEVPRVWGGLKPAGSWFLPPVGSQVTSLKTHSQQPRGSLGLNQGGVKLRASRGISCACEIMGSGGVCSS